MPVIKKGNNTYGNSPSLNIETVLNDTHNEIPTSKAVYDAIEGCSSIIECTQAQYSEWEENGEIRHNYLYLVSDANVAPVCYSLIKTTLWEGNSLTSENETLTLLDGVKNYDTLCITCAFSGGQERKTDTYIDTNNITFDSNEDFGLIAHGITSVYLNNTVAISFQNNKSIEVKVGSQSVVITKVVGIRNVQNPIENNYSTDEQVIGKWIDGKPIYRKVCSYIAEIPESASAETIIGVSPPIQNIEQLVKIYGNYTSAPDTRQYPLPYTIQSGSTIRIVYDYTQGIIIIKGNGIGASKNHYIIIEYTKTTD